jgi:predicted acyltransferase
LYNAVFAPLPLSPYNTSLLYAIALLGLMFLIAYAMHRRGWYWRV